MQKLMMVFCVLLGITSLLFADDGSQAHQTDKVWASGFVHLGAAFWASGGAGIADPDNAEALLYNPAWRMQAKHLIIGGGLQRLSAQLQYATDSTADNGQLVIPNYVLGVSRYGKWMFQGGYREVYNVKNHVSRSLVPLPEQSDAYVNLAIAQRVSALFMGVNRLLGEKLSVGVQTGLLLAYAETNTDEKKYASGSGIGFDFKAGLLYQPSERVALAVTYYYLHSIDYNVQYEPELMMKFYLGTSRTLRFPSSLAGGVYWKPLNHLSLSFKIQYQNWKAVQSSMDNRLEVAAGLHFQPAKKIGLRLGGFTSGNYLNGQKNFEDVFFTSAGIDYKMRKNLIFSLSALTSHFFAGKTGKGYDQLDQLEILMGIQLRLWENP